MFSRSAKAVARMLVIVGACGGVSLLPVPGAAIRLATAQVPEMTVAVGGPRFFFASSKTARPVEVDAIRTMVLRQRVSLKLERPTVASLLAAIAKQTGMEFIYSREGLPVDRVVGLRADSITVAAALTEILVDTGFDVLLSPGRQVVLVERRSVATARGIGTIVGRVTDGKSGAGVSAVEVYLDGTRWRTATDSLGRYRLTDVDTGTYTLIARRLGYTKQNRRVTVAGERVDTVDLVVDPVALALDELVTTATGQQRRRDLGNAITTIHADSVLQSAPIRNLTDLLENRVPGLTLQRTTGAPGDPSRLRLRGIGSVLRGNDPIVIVDGIRMYSTQSDARSGNLTNAGCIKIINGACPPNRQDTIPGVAGNLPAPSPLDQIDPNIIEKIEVFKGPSAATLYGADAANGVIVITTKRGKPGPVRWNTNVSHARTVTPGKWPVAYYRWGVDVETSGVPAICPLIVVGCVQDSLVRFQALNDPSMTVLGQGRRTGVSLTASGGTQSLTYSVTGTYADELGLLKLPAFEKERFRSTYSREAPEWMRRPHKLENWNVGSRVQAQLSPAMDLTLFTSLGRTEQQRSGLENKLAGLASTYVDRVNGRYYPTAGFMDERQFFFFNDASSGFLQDYYTRTTASVLTFTTGLNAAWYPRNWFKASAQAGLDVKPREDERFLPTGLPGAADSGVLIRGVGRSLVGTFNLQGAVRRPLPWGFVFETSIGANLTTTSTADVITSATHLQSGTSTVTGARNILATDGRAETSVFGWYLEPRFTGQRLSLSTGIRIDGGSAYGARVTSGGFKLPKLNGSWVISEEPFFPFKSIFSSFRLRAAYGQAQVQPGAMDRLRFYAGRVEDKLWLTTVGNPDLRPERATEFEGGVDADLLDSRIRVELTAYQKTQVDALMPAQLPVSVNGGGMIVQNVGNIRNRGLELSLDVAPIQTSFVTWRTQLLYSRNTNVLMKLGRGVLPSKEQGLVEGYPVGARWAKPIAGYTDQNGDGLLSRTEVQVGDSLVFMGRLLPDYTAGLHTNLVLFGGAVAVAAVFSYESGATQIDQTSRANWVLVRGATDPSAPFSEQAAILASTPATNVSVNGATDYGLMQDVSTFRFNTFSVNYQVPTGVARLLRAQRLTASVRASNLGIHSTYTGKDPNVNSWSAGEGIVDTGQLPQPRTWELALFLQY